MSWLFTSGGQSIGASASATVLPMNIQGGFPLRLTGLMTLQSKGLSRVFSSITTQKHPFFFGAQSSPALDNQESPSCLYIYIAFCDWLSFSIMFSSFIYVVAYSFFWSNNITLYRYITFYLSIHSSIDGIWIVSTFGLLGVTLL